MESIIFNAEDLNKSERLAYEKMNESERQQFEKLYVQIAEKKEKMLQTINRSKVRNQRESYELNQKLRKERTRKLIEYGAMLTKFLPEDLENEKVLEVLKSCLTTEYSKNIINTLRTGENNDTLTN